MSLTKDWRCLCPDQAENKPFQSKAILLDACSVEKGWGKPIPSGGPIGPKSRKLLKNRSLGSLEMTANRVFNRALDAPKGILPILRSPTMSKVSIVLDRGVKSKGLGGPSRLFLGPGLAEQFDELFVIPVTRLLYYSHRCFAVLGFGVDISTVGDKHLHGSFVVCLAS